MRSSASIYGLSAHAFTLVNSALLAVPAPGSCGVRS